MQYEAKTPEEYLSQLELDWRKEKLHEIRQIILSKGENLKEVIKYKMLGFADEKGVIMQLNAQRNYVSLYVGTAAKIDTDGDLLEGLDVGKGCIRFKKTTEVSDTRIDEFIERTLQFWKEGKDIDC